MRMGSETTYNDHISRYLLNLSEQIFALDIHSNAIAEAARILYESKLRGRTVWIIGNGGSAATAAHFANDLTKMVKLPAVAIPSQTSTVLAYGNDAGWENMFANAFCGLAAAGDVLIAITCSGKSGNIIKAVKMAEDMGCLTIVLTGKREGNPFANAPHAIFVEADDIKIQEDCHLAICHAIAGAMAEA
jgi:D-sedoheptulose 7-phosphate isomerase